MSEAAARLSTRELSADEISDAVWLAAQITAAQPRDPPPPTPAAASPGSTPRDPDHSPPPVPWNTKPSPTPRPSFTHVVRLASSDEPASASDSGIIPVRSMLPDLQKGLAKALQPLNELAPSRSRVELDEEKTAEATAESGRWILVDRPAWESPYEVVLVVDRGSSMVIWERTAAAFRRLLERQGAFADVKTVSVRTDEKIVRSVETAPGTSCSPGQLADPTGKRIILVLTDSVGHAWHTGSMFSVIRMWSRTCHVALVHVLPVDRWSWSGIRVESRIIRDGSSTSSDIPVLALERRYLRRWAELMSGATGGVRLPVLVPPDDDDSEVITPHDDVSADERLERFWATATTDASRLAGLLAAAPLNRRTMAAVHGTLLPRSKISDLAEVFLGGLLRRVPSSPDKTHPLVEYEFKPGLRRRLLATVTRDETAHVQRVVHDTLGNEDPVIAVLRNVISEPEHTPLPVITHRNAALLEVVQQVLAALSGPYSGKARYLSVALTNHYHNDTATESPTRQPDADGPSGNTTPIHPAGNRPVTTTKSERGAEFTRSQKLSIVWGGVPLRNVNFIGRKDLLAALHSELTKSTETAVLPGALHGMGGIGKSQIAVEYVYRYAADYDLVWWIPSENSSEIQLSLVKLAQRLELPVEHSIDTAVPAVLEALSIGVPHRRWLLVFDNADKPEEVRRFWPRRGGGHIIVTSRNTRWAEVARTVEVDVFQRSESRELLQRRNSDLGDDDADRIATVLGDLPLAIEQAAAWRAETGMTVDEYLRLFEDKRAELLESRAPVDYDVAVEAAWNVSLDKLREEKPGALELLEVCAFFSPEPIPKAIFSGVRNIPVSADLEPILADPLELGRAIREINRYSLAKIDHRNNTLQLHRLVQLVLRNKLNRDDQERVLHTAHLLLAGRDPRAPEAVEHWPTYAELLPHVRAVEARNCTDSWVRRLAINATIYLYAFGDPVGCLELAEDHATFWAEKLGEKHPDTLVISRWWGRMLRTLGRFEEGRAVAERTLKFMRETLGEEHEETLLTMHAVASDLRSKGDFHTARDMNRTAYRTAVDKFGEDDPDTLAAANNYALSLRLAGDFAAARDLDEETVRRKQVVLGEDHRLTLLTLDNWSVDLRETGDYLRARVEQEDTVRRMRAQLGDRHPMTLSAIKNLAIAYRKAGDHINKKALNLAIEASEGLIAKHGESHPDAMSASLDLSIEHRQDGNLVEARRIGEYVKDLYERTWGPEHPFGVAAATNLAVTLRLMGMAEQARTLNVRALERMRESVGEDHPFTLVCATNLASDLAELDDFDAAYNLDQDTYARSVRVLGASHPSSLALLVNQALDLRGLGRHEEAASTQIAAVEEMRRVLGPTHPATNDAQFNHRANCDIDPMQV